ncbi:hypothetical protein SLE2022_169890 [Rubroshorea leprosula]
MAIIDFLAEEIAKELLKKLIAIIRKSCLCKSSAEGLISTINELLPIIQEIEDSGVKLPLIRKMKKLETKVASFINGPMLAHVLADVLHIRSEIAERFDRLEQRLGSICLLMVIFLQGRDGTTWASSLARSFHNMPYLVSCSLTATNNNGFYYCNENEYNATVEFGATEDEQWSYCCA